MEFCCTSTTTTPLQIACSVPDGIKKQSPFFTGTADETSFVSLLITEGEGRLTCGGETVQAKKGDSFFITAGSGAYALTGSCKALLTTV